MRETHMDVNVEGFGGPDGVIFATLAIAFVLLCVLYLRRILQVRNR
ncbi:MAG TPA: hypothetical protein VIO32_00575 [Candidatus Baltobacteraceae bacterium]